MKKGFTLLELLLTIGILAILATVVVVIINPVEYLKQSRDTRRIKEINAIDAAIATARASAPNISLGGSTSTVYVSIPDPTLVGNATSTCGGISGMPILSPEWRYQCVSVANLRKTDGTGWIPVNFDSIAIKSPLSSLPIDPSNEAAGRKFYTYVPLIGLSARLESQKVAGDAGAKDGGVSDLLFEIGGDIAHLPTSLFTGL